MRVLPEINEAFVLLLLFTMALFCAFTLYLAGDAQMGVFLAAISPFILIFTGCTVAASHVAQTRR